jgi:hypothetical protein
VFDLDTYLTRAYRYLGSWLLENELYDDVTPAKPQLEASAHSNRLRNTFERHISDDSDWESFLPTLKCWKVDGAKQFQVKMKMAFMGVPAVSKKAIEKSPIIINDSSTNPTPNSVKEMLSFGRDEIERGRSSTSDLQIFEEGISKKESRMSAVEAGDEHARLIDFLIENGDPKQKEKDANIVEVRPYLARDLAYIWPRCPYQYYLCATSFIRL